MVIGYCQVASIADAQDGLVLVLIDSMCMPLGGLAHVAHALLSRLPSSVLNRLPTPAVLRIRALSQRLKSEHLPTVVEADGPAADKR